MQMPLKVVPELAKRSAVLAACLVAGFIAWVAIGDPSIGSETLSAREFVANLTTPTASHKITDIYLEPGVHNWRFEPLIKVVFDNAKIAYMTEPRDLKELLNEIPAEYNLHVHAVHSISRDYVFLLVIAPLTVFMNSLLRRRFSQSRA